MFFPVSYLNLGRTSKNIYLCTYSDIVKKFLHISISTFPRSLFLDNGNGQRSYVFAGAVTRRKVHSTICTTSPPPRSTYYDSESIQFSHNRGKEDGIGPAVTLNVHSTNTGLRIRSYIVLPACCVV